MLSINLPMPYIKIISYLCNLKTNEKKMYERKRIENLDYD